MPGPSNYVSLFFSSRLFITAMCFLGVLLMVTARLNMSVAILCMVNHTALRNTENDTSSADHQIRTDFMDNATVGTNSEAGLPRLRSQKCGSRNASEPEVTRADGPFVWTKDQQGIVLGAYFWGYLMFQVPSGWIVRKFGSVRMLGISTLISSLFCLAIPLLAHFSYMAVAVLRACVGFVAGMVCPAVHNLLSHWLPPTERAKMSSFAYSGYSFGALVTFTGSGLLCKYGFADGWQSIFYVYGGFGLVFAMAWYTLVNESPAQHKRISNEEKKFIESKMEGMKKGKSLSMPWKAIFTSLPVYAILFTSIANDFYSIIMWLFLPTYLSDVMNFEISSNGAVSSLPYIFQFFLLLFFGWLSDAIVLKGWLSIGAVRKTFCSGGIIICMISVITMGFLGCDQPTLAVVFIVLSIGLGLGVMTIGYYVNPLDIAPAYAGLIVAIANTVGTLTGFISPYVVTAITHENSSQETWQIIFLISAAVLFAALIFYASFASGEVQPWAAETTDIKCSLNMELDIQPENDDESVALNKGSECNGQSPAHASPVV